MVTEIVPLVTFNENFVEMLGCGLYVAIKSHNDAPDCLLITLINNYCDTEEPETDTDHLVALEQFIETVIIHACRYSLWYTSDQIRSAFDIWDL